MMEDMLTAIQDGFGVLSTQFQQMSDALQKQQQVFQQLSNKNTSTKESEQTTDNPAKLRNNSNNGKIRLDVGGTKFTTTVTTLNSAPDSYFAAMLNFNDQQTEEFFIDRDPSLFNIILNFLRNDQVMDNIPLSKHQQLALDHEATYYGLTSLSSQIQQRAGCSQQQAGGTSHPRVVWSQEDVNFVNNKESCFRLTCEGSLLFCFVKQVPVGVVSTDSSPLTDFCIVGDYEAGWFGYSGISDWKVQFPGPNTQNSNSLTSFHLDVATHKLHVKQFNEDATTVAKTDVLDVPQPPNCIQPRPPLTAQFLLHPWGNAGAYEHVD
eukprot:TRINITY_DN67099_c2_g2_i5.p1 TRINITY_DN67099_c2_g2~~TRINITY_DN67099_c2_g2_i5.p1  ORF type:complete len:321 (+),score=55.46 TRINITY_DN67099_c2_g2_i5:83-1045(+)